MAVAAKDKVLTARQAARMSRILSTAQQLLGEVGVEQMTMRALAVASGVSAATLYNRFGTKDGVVTLAVLDHYEREIRRVIRSNAHLGTPVAQLVASIRVIVADCLRRPGFAAALMSAYFKIGNEREMPTRLYETQMQSWLPLLQAMHEQGSLQSWASIPLLAEELSDRMFGVVMKWVQGMIPDAAFADRAVITVLLPLAAGSQAAQATELAAVIAATSRRLERQRAKPAAARRRS